MAPMDSHPRSRSTRMDSRRLRDDRRLRICRNQSVQTECHMASHSDSMREGLRRLGTTSGRSRSVRMARKVLR